MVVVVDSCTYEAVTHTRPRLVFEHGVALEASRDKESVGVRGCRVALEASRCIHGPAAAASGMMEDSPLTEAGLHFTWLAGAVAGLGTTIFGDMTTSEITADWLPLFLILIFPLVSVLYALCQGELCKERPERAAELLEVVWEPNKTVALLCSKDNPETNARRCIIMAHGTPHVVSTHCHTCPPAGVAETA